MQRSSAAELRERRAVVVSAVREQAPLELVNGGGTGSAELTASEAALTEVGAGDLAVGDRVWFRHAKAGELCEHVDDLHVVEEGAVAETVATYRGESKVFL